MLLVSNVKRPSACLALIICLAVSLQVSSQELYPIKLTDSLWHNEQRELRYKPEGEDFVIVNGSRLFTRALYGTNTAFRVEAGDRPEFALYMPGMGGNFKLGIASGNTSIWLTKAKSIIARYRAGSMIYTISDPILGKGSLALEVLAMADAEGFIIKVHLKDTKETVNLFGAFGGASGKKFSRDGDMGPDPESSFYLKPENCKDNSYAINKESFTLRYGAGVQVGQDGRYFAEDLSNPPLTSKEQLLEGTFPKGFILKIGDATEVETPAILYKSTVNKAPVIIGKLKIEAARDYYFVIHNPATKPPLSYSMVPKVFQQALARRKLIAGRIKIRTPDPYINTIGGALAVASDATWEAPSYLHGSVGWRMRLNGWRGAYTADALGWHDRARTHLGAYAQSQVITPLAGQVVADTSTHLSRSLEKLGIGMFTSGYITRDPDGKSPRAHHYDMNLVYIDILLRHYAWTGDTAFVRKTWAVLKRHLEWEKRNFDADGDGLYDAYAAIWASDALQYSGGGVTHTSAYNCLAFKKAAEIAILMGEDPAPYREESDKILKAMNRLLWMPAKGSFAEFKDALGNRLLHESPAIWTIYHSMDSEALNPFQAYESMRYIDNEIPHIPVRAKGLKDDNYYTISTTSWMPYTWSLNNVALGESMHAILANWQAGRTDEAFKLFKSEVLASMYLGGSPGNFVQISHFDAVRGEAYRDFGDPVGIFSRALVEGLFGIVPDALNNTITIRPGLPVTWNYASFATPDFSFDFKRSGTTDTYMYRPKFSKSLKLKFRAIARGQVKSITLNGKAIPWKILPASVGLPVIEIDAPPLKANFIKIIWEGSKPALPPNEKTYAEGSVITEMITGAKVAEVHDPQKILTAITPNATGFTAKITGTGGKYTVFARVIQGSLSWWMPVCFRVEKAVTLMSQNSNEANSTSFRLQNNSAVDVPAAVTVNNYKINLKIAAGKRSDEIRIPVADLITGTNPVNVSINGTGIFMQLIDWNARTTGTMEMVDLSGYFNDKVTQVFRNKYLAPRPAVTTLQLPWQGTGDWPHPLETHDIDDRGLRRLAGDKNSFVLPQGIAFSTPGVEGKKNILFTSQWDNYPESYRIPLSGNASHAWLLMAGSTNPMQSRLNNGLVVIEYTDGATDSLVLRNPDTWWPIEKDYYSDGFAFALQQPRPIRVHLKTGNIISGEESGTRFNGKEINGGAATVLDLPLDKSRTLRSLTLKTLANDVVIGLMAVTLLRP